jgi:hypothetical protein
MPPRVAHAHPPKRTKSKSKPKAHPVTKVVTTRSPAKIERAKRREFILSFVFDD